MSKSYSVTSIGSSAFDECTSLTSVSIPNSITSIGWSAFGGCKSLTSVNIPNSVTSIGSSAFSGCSGLTSVAIPNSVTSIGSGAFYNCTGLTSITIGNSVTEIGESAFEGCKSLTSVTIPNSVTLIREHAFDNCEGLTSVTIGNSVTEIREWAFFNCDIIKIYSAAENAPAIYINSFSNFTHVNCVVYIPQTAKASYESKWSIFKIYAVPENPIKKTYTINTPGDLINQVNIDEIESITEIKLIGKINGTDILTLNKLVYLTSVDLSQATIVEGGMSYYEKDNDRFGTQNNTLGGYWAYNLKFLEQVKLPNDLKVIGKYAFSEFFQIKSLEIPNSVTSIGECAFYDCSGLTSVTIPNSVTSIGSYAFNGCRALKDLKFEDGDETLLLERNRVHSSSLGTYYLGLFSGCPIKTLYLGRKLYSEYPPFAEPKAYANNNTTIESVIIGNLITEINSSILSVCENLKEVHISSLETWCKIDFVENNPFGHEHYLYLNDELVKDIVIPESISNIKKYAFDGCSGLTSVTIPNSVTSIGSSAFRSCTSLTSVTIPNSVTSIGESAFYNCKGLTSVSIPNSVTSIGEGAFGYCSKLTSVAIPNSVTSISRETFDGCKGLTSVTIPNSVTEIGKSAFSGCSSLIKINIPGSVREIGSNAFAECGLTEITMINPIPAVIESNTFSVYEVATLNVPDGSRNIYWIHPYWGQFKNIKVSGSESVEDFVADDVTYHVTSELLATVEVSAANLSANSRSAGRKLAIPESVTYNDKEYTVAGIANNGFENTGLTEITLPATINYVGLNAFKGCNGLVSITCSAVLPPSVDLSSFDEDVYNKATLNVLESSVEDYENNAVWRKFKMGALSGIESVTNDADDAVQVVDGCIVAPEGCEVFDLYGHSVNPENLSRGIYIVRMKNGETVKVKI